MNYAIFVLTSLALVVLTACGGKSNSNSSSKDSEFLKVSAQLRQTLPQLDETLSSQSLEGIWRIASYTRDQIRHERTQENLVPFSVDATSSSQILVVIHKDYTADNAYIIYNCSSYSAIESWVLNGNTLSYKAVNENDASFSVKSGNLVLTDNLSLVGGDHYQYSSKNSDEQENTIYAGVKVSDSINFKEAQDINIDLQINQKDIHYQLSDNLVSPGCFSISKSEGEGEFWHDTLATDVSEAKSQSQTSSSFVVSMMDGGRISADEGVTVTDSETSIDFSSYYSDVSGPQIRLNRCSEDLVLTDEECLKSTILTTKAESNAMSALIKSESLAGETFDITFSYSKE